MVPHGITTPEVQPDTWQGSLTPESTPRPRLLLTKFSPLACYYSTELRPEQAKTLLSEERPRAQRYLPKLSGAAFLRVVQLLV